MSVFVLVHGAWHGGWCWQRVTPLLRAQGHEVLVPTLTGLGERAGELTPAVGLATHVEDIVEALGQSREPAILVGHSYAGLVVRQAAARAPERVGRLALVEGWVGPSGSSLISLAPEWFSDGIRLLAEERGEGWRIPAPDPVVVGVSDPDDAAWLRRHLTDQPLRTFTEPTLLDERTTIPTSAIVAPQGPVPFATLATDLGFPIVEIEGGHDLMVTSPAALASALLELP